MGDAIVRALNAAAASWAGVWLATLLKGALLLLLAEGASALLRRRSAAVRHLVWTLALGGLLLLPVLWATGLRLSVRLPAWLKTPEATTSRGRGGVRRGSRSGRRPWRRPL